MNPWTDTFLDQARQRQDPSADTVIAEIFASGDLAQANALFRRIQLNQDGIPNDVGPDILEEWMERTDALPTWYDPRKCLAGQRLFQRHGMAIVAALFNRALPQSYCGWKGVQALHMTSQLTRDPTRRIAETAQLVFDVTDPDAFEKNGRGIRSCQKIRLVHAGVRYLIHHQRPPRWNPAWDMPINQEDMAGTIQLFSMAVLDSLEKMSIDHTPEEAAGYMHLWKVAGYLLGVEEALLCDDYNEGRRIEGIIAKRQFSPSSQGREMAQALIKCQQDILPGRLADGSIPVVMRWLMGDEYADMLDLPQAPLTGLLIKPVRIFSHFMDEAGDESKLASSFFSKFNRSMMRGLHAWFRDYRKIEFRISPTLAQQWEL